MKIKLSPRHVTSPNQGLSSLAPFGVVEVKDPGNTVVTLLEPSVPLTTLFTKWPCVFLTELNFYPPATGNSKKREKIIALLLT